MRKALILLLILTLVPISECQNVDVKILGDFKHQVVTYSYTQSDGFLIFDSEFFNPGSVGYNVKARFDIFNGTKMIYSAWSPERLMEAGSRERFVLYWFPGNLKGNFSVQGRFYYNNELEVLGKEQLQDFEPSNPVIEIDVGKVKVFDDGIFFDITPNETLEGAVIIPMNFPSGWVVDQATVGRLESGKKHEIDLPYESGSLVEATPEVLVISKDGKFYGFRQFNLEKEKGFSKFLHLFQKFTQEAF
jgi:hypothetical protein